MNSIKKMPGSSWDTLKAQSRMTSEKEPITYGFMIYNDKATRIFDMHFDLEIGIVFSGRMERFYEGHQEVLCRGDLWLHSMWEPHGFRLAAVPCKLLVIVIDPRFLSTLQLGHELKFNWMASFACTPKNRPQLNSSQKKKVLEIARSLEREISNHTIGAEIKRRMLVLEILLLLAGNLNPQRTGELQVYGSIQPALEQVFTTKSLVSVTQAAQACAMSASVFRKRFKKLMHTSFAKFSLSYRIKQVAAQLRQTNDSLLKIADDWGFADAAHLHRCFVRIMGCLPAKYRKNSAS